VLDVDWPQGGKSLYLLGQQGHVLPETRRAFTGGKGTHYYFQATGFSNKVGLLPGIDYRGAGGYVVAPPSRHRSGRRYEWDDRGMNIAPAPDWLLAIRSSRPGPAAVRPWAG
jgi:hypothetical protein